MPVFCVFPDCACVLCVLFVVVLESFQMSTAFLTELNAAGILLGVCSAYYISSMYVSHSAYDCSSAYPA